MIIGNTFGYLRFGRTGSTSIWKALEKITPVQQWNTAHPHHTLDATPYGLYKDKFIIGSIRSPWYWYRSKWLWYTKYTSMYKWMLAMNRIEETPEMLSLVQDDSIETFQQFMRCMAGLYTTLFDKMYYRDGELGVNYWICIETMVADLARIFEIKPATLKKIRKQKQYKKQKFAPIVAYYTDELSSLIQEKDKKIIEMFGYEI